MMTREEKTQIVKMSILEEVGWTLNYVSGEKVRKRRDGIDKPCEHGLSIPGQLF